MRQRRIIPTEQATLLRWAGGANDYESIKGLVEKVAQDERAAARQTTPLNAADVLAPIGQNWTLEPGGHQQARGGLWDQNDWNEWRGYGDEADGWINKAKGGKGQSAEKFGKGKEGARWSQERAR